MRYILNSAVITAPGAYTYALVSDDEACAWLDAGPYVSTIGYAETAQAFTALLGRTVEHDVGRRQIRMERDDEALVLRLTSRLPDPAAKGAVGVEWIQSHAEMGVLRRTG